MLQATGLTLDSIYSYNGEIRVYIGNERVNMGRVNPWNTTENVYIPLRPLLEALGAKVTLNEDTGKLTVKINDGEKDVDTVMFRDADFFIKNGAMTTTMNEFIRLFPYRVEWFPEFNLIAVSVPPNLVATW
jgi:hypothetical protein